MVILYNLFITLYGFGIKIAASINPKARLWISGRKKWQQDLISVRKENESWIWMHCSSLGEYEDSHGVFNLLQNDHQETKFLLTFFSPSGYEAMRGSGIGSHIAYFPLDTQANAKQFLDILKPDLILFSRSELWYNFLIEISKRNIPTYLLSLSLQQESNFLKWPAKKIYARCFNSFSHIFCQNISTQKILADQFNITKTSIIGNTRFDRIISQLNKKKFKEVEFFIAKSFCIVVGSCLKKDEKMIHSAIKSLASYKIKWIIVPHEINNKKINATVLSNPQMMLRYADIHTYKGDQTCLYIDFVGALKYLYRYADLAIIGGGFNKIGIHNIVEPTAYGVKTLFGPNHRNYQEALDLLKLKTATIYRNENELIENIKANFENPIPIEMKNQIAEYVRTHTGSSERIRNHINQSMKNINLNS